jgi:uncharacterized protein (DUF2147 family)
MPSGQIGGNDNSSAGNRAVTQTIIRITAGIILLVASASGSGGEDILGVWNNEDGRAKIEIFHCGGHYCGRIVWLKQPDYPADDAGGMGRTPRVDRDNPNPALRNRRLLGLQIMEGFTYSGANSWDKGVIYDPESGNLHEQDSARVSSPPRNKGLCRDSSLRSNHNLDQIIRICR